MIKENYIVHITHNDSDAVGCALVAGLYFKNKDIQTHFCATTGADAVLKESFEFWDEHGYPEVLLITDISVSVEMADHLERLKSNEGFRLISVDHHPTNPNTDRSWVHYFTTKIFGCVEEPISAAYGLCHMLFEIDPMNITQVPHDLMEEYNTKFDLTDGKLFHTSFKLDKDHRYKVFLQKLIHRISRYDTWAWKKNPKPWMMEDMIAIITNAYGPETTFEMLMQYYLHEIDDRIASYHGKYVYETTDISETDERGNEICYPPEFVPCYHFVKRSEATYTSMDFIIKNVKTYIDGEYQFASFIGDGINANVVADMLYHKFPDVDIALILFCTTKTLSFRSNRTTVDLGRYAKRLYGGGGHHQAAGAKVDIDTYLNAMKKHYESESISTLDKTEK